MRVKIVTNIISYKLNISYLQQHVTNIYKHVNKGDFFLEKTRVI